MPALALLAALLFQAPPDPLAAARAELSSNHLAAAESLLRSHLRSAPDDAPAHFLLGYTLLRQNHPTESLAEYTAGARTENPSAEDLTAVASDYVLLKDLPDAARWLHRATTEAPDNQEAWYLLGRTEYNQDHAAEALAAFDRVLALDPHSIRAQNNRGLALERLGRPAEALAAYRASIAAQQGTPHPDPQPFLNLGDLLLVQHHPAEALTALQQAAALSPRNPYIQQQLGQAFEALNRNPEAIAAYRASIALAPSAEQPHFFLARLLQRTGDTAESRAEFSIVTRLLGDTSSRTTPNFDQVP